ncbi:Major facilitator superfamily domain, general substrate transporter [Moelleriella libera RCEF 2490]|uniref:Major facilitator superfamily domain, general substrate transporter n=1 Tax=Moelleriella libera RCEF 2490 TaxID=1081109 RepID=A0A167YC27_9HYPO|nr:Major facilitator superfamily domain, general substrate transporter [Moelleriella libera RCEF 2490]
MTEIAPPRVAASEAKDDGLVQLEHAETDQPSPLAKGPTDYSGARAKSDPVEIALVRKLDRRILPMLWGMYFLNYLDRSAIASARLNSLEEDCHLKGSEYNTCISVLFVGYLLMQLPSNMLMASSKVRPSLYMGVCMALWGVVSGLTAVANSYSGLVLLRFFLGVVEAPFYPGALFLLSIYYTRKEVATRLAILYSANIMSTAFSGLIAAATFATLDGAHGLRGWRWLFIIEGIVTVVVAAVAIPVLPDHPLTTRWLTAEERQLAHDRIARDTVEQSHKASGTLASLRVAFGDPRLYLLALMQNMHLSANGFTNFFPTVVKSLRFSHTITLVLTCPPFVVAAVVAPLYGLSSGRHNERTWHITGGMSLAMVGFVVAACTLNVAARYVACFCFSVGVYCVNSCILGWASATLGQTMQKKAISLSFINMVANASYIYTPYLFPKSDGPQYAMAMGAEAGFTGATILCAWALKFWIMQTNRRLRRDNPESHLAYAY